MVRVTAMKRTLSLLLAKDIFRVISPYVDCTDLSGRLVWYLLSHVCCV